VPLPFFIRIFAVACLDASVTELPEAPPLPPGAYVSDETVFETVEKEQRASSRPAIISVAPLARLMLCARPTCPASVQLTVLLP
jgi:hypothetical protein